LTQLLFGWCMNWGGKKAQHHFPKIGHLIVKWILILYWFLKTGYLSRSNAAAKLRNEAKKSNFFSEIFFFFFSV
jgi:hypothetical protein